MSSIYSLISQSIPSQTSIIFLTQSLRVQTILAHFIAQHQPKSLCIFLDFDQQYITQINSQILRVSQQLMFEGKYINIGAKIQSINKTVNKRKIAYQSFGFLAVSSVVFVLDLLCYIIHPALVNRVFIKRLERVKSNEHHYNWISELVQRQTGNCKFTLICNSVSDMGKEQFMKLYDMFCVEKIIIWPFGRKQILEAVKNSPHIDQYQHTLPMSKIKQQVQTTLISIMKQWASGIKSQRSIVDIFTKEMYLNVQSTRFMADIYQLRLLLLKLVNESYVDWLILLYSALGVSDRYSLWVSSSDSTENQIEGIKRLLFKQIFQFKMTEVQREIKVRREDLEFAYQCKYQLNVLAPYPQKIDELFKILKQYSNKIEKKEPESKQDVDILIIIPKSMKDYDLLGNRYHKQLLSIYEFLKISDTQRLWHLKKTKSKLQKQTKLSPSQYVKQNEMILLEQLEGELKLYQKIVDQYLVLSELIDITLDRTQLFNKFISKVQKTNFRYIDPDRLRQCQLKLSQRIGVTIITNEDMQQTFSMRRQQPHVIIFYTPSLKMLRNIFFLQAQLSHSTLQQIYTINVSKSIEQNIYKQRFLKQDTNFWEISKLRPTLPKILMDISSRVTKLTSKNTKARDQTKNIINEVDASKLHLFNIGATTVIPEQKFYVVVDKREFKSELPAVLFHYGFQVVPMFLTVSDYILADDVQVERKQIATYDLHNSIRTGRLDSQLKNMSAKIKHPYLLIEFPSRKDFNKKYLTESYNRVTNETYNTNIRRQVLMLLRKYPKVIPIWSQNPRQTAEMFFELKKNKPQPDISVYSVKETEKEEDDLNVELVANADDQIIV